MITLLGFLCWQPLLLTGHHGQINAMTFGKGSRPVLLCSASSDYVIVWDVEHCQRRIHEGKISMSLCVCQNQSLTLFFAGKVATGTVIGTLLGEITHLSFCFCDEQVAACSGTTIYVISYKVRHTVHLISWDAQQHRLQIICRCQIGCIVLYRSHVVILAFPIRTKAWFQH